MAKLHKYNYFLRHNKGGHKLTYFVWSKWYRWKSVHVAL